MVTIGSQEDENSPLHQNTSPDDCSEDLPEMPSTDTPHVRQNETLEDFVPKHSAQYFGIGVAGYRSVSRHTVVGHVCFQRHSAELDLMSQSPAITG